MFKKTWWKGIISDSGFAVNIKPPNKVEYREGDKLLIAYMDMLRGDPAIDIDSNSIKSWLPPHQNEPLTPEKKQEILNNICDALRFSGLTYVIR